jgi:HK97 family phage major capsid protein
MSDGKVTLKVLEDKISDIIGMKLDEVRAELDNRQKDYTALVQEIISQTRPKVVVPPEEKALRTAAFMRSLACAKKYGDNPMDWLNKWGHGELVKQLGESALSTGGALVPEDLAQEVIEFLRAKTLVRQMGARTLPMPNGSLTLPRMSAGAVASYIGENTNVPQSDQVFGQIQMTAKKLAVLTPVSNDLLRDASGSVDELVRDDLTQAASVREDAAFIRDNGTVNTPKGIRFQDSIQTQAQTGVTVANATTDIGICIQNLMDQNIPMTRPGWMISPREWRALITARGTDGVPIFRSEMEMGRLFGFPFGITTQIPTNLGAGNESEVYFVDFAQAVIGEAMDMEVSVVDGAAYNDGSNLVSAFSLDQTVIKLITRHDFAMRFVGLDACVITGVTWGVAGLTP